MASRERRVGEQEMGRSESLKNVGWPRSFNPPFELGQPPPAASPNRTHSQRHPRFMPRL